MSHNVTSPDSGAANVKAYLKKFQLLVGLKRVLGTIRRDIAKRLEMSSARRALLQSTALSASEKQLLKSVSLHLAPHDGMYVPGHSRHYLGVGLSAMRCIDRALRHTQTNVTNILDLPSGHGRVLRFLRVAFENADITACELDPDAVQFCENTFGAAGVLSTPDPSALSFPRQFDLIWCGSLVTHMDQSQTMDLLRVFSRHLAPGGLCLFTTHGKTTLKWVQDGSYLRSVNGREKVLAEFTARGYGYADYDPRQPGYGISFVSFERMTQIASEIGDWSLAVFLQAGWDDHQDVYGFFKPHTGRTSSNPLIVNAVSTKHEMGAPIF